MHFVQGWESSGTVFLSKWSFAERSRKEERNSVVRLRLCLCPCFQVVMFASLRTGAVATYNCSLI